MDIAALAPLVPVAQFFIGLPLAYAAGSFVITATYKTDEDCIMLIFFVFFGILALLAGLFNWTWFFYIGKFGRIMRHSGPFAARMMCLLFGLVMTIGTVLGSANERSFSERMWPLNGPIIEGTLPDHLPQPKTGNDRFRAPGARRPPGF